MPSIRKLFRPAPTAAISATVLPGVCGAAAPAQASTATTARSLLSKVSVTAESNTGYDRGKFTHWIDANGGCQDTRKKCSSPSQRSLPPTPPAAGAPSAPASGSPPGTQTAWIDRQRVK